jgi:hypothetical protein
MQRKHLKGNAMMTYINYSCLKIFLFSFLITAAAYAQQASDYFPSQTGYKWNYKVVPLDSVNNQVDSLTFFRADSFAAAENYNGRNADIVLTKAGPSGIINSLPYLDSSFFSFENADGLRYFRILYLDNLISVLDSIGIDTTFLNYLQSFEDWYSVYRFDSPVNSDYTVFTRDTVLSFNGHDYPLRFEFKGTRQDDETITVDAGTFLCKKFLFADVVSYLIMLPPPLPPIPVEIFREETNDWISQNVWTVRERIPSRNIDLSYFGFGTYNVPGLLMELLPNIVPVELESFTANTNGNNVTLNWQTATETNNKGFYVERFGESLKTDWVNIGFVPGNGTSSDPKSYSFIDKNVSAGRFSYRLKQIDFDGSFKYSNEVAADVAAPDKFSLAQNYPNPFNPSTKIEFNLPESGNVTLTIYNILGKEVASLMNEKKNAGSYSVTFNPRPDKISSGIYFYVLKFKGMQLSHKMIFLK